MKLITNLDSQQNHLTNLVELLRDAEEVWIATAFLRDKGVRRLKEELNRFIDRGGRMTVIAGRDLYITEPDALQSMLSLMNGGRDCRLYLKHLTTKGAFHPKIYLFRMAGKSRHVLVGSANFTGPAMSENAEASLLHSISVDHEDAAWNEALDLFNRWTAPGSAEEVKDTDVIEAYRSEWIRRKGNDRSIRQQEVNENMDLSQELTTLRDIWNGIGYSRVDQEYHRRFQNYMIARRILDGFADSRHLAGDAFIWDLERLIGKEHLFASDHLYRKGKEVAYTQTPFIQLIRRIRSNIGMAPEDLYLDSKIFIQQNGIVGCGRNLITEIMHAFDPIRYAVFNSRAVTAMENLLPDTYGAAQRRKSQEVKYQLLCNAEELIRQTLEMTDFTEVDTLLHFHYVDMPMNEDDEQL